MNLHHVDPMLQDPLRHSLGNQSSWARCGMIFVQQIVLYKSFSGGHRAHHRQAWRIDHTHGAPTAHTAHRTLPFLCTILAHRGNEINWGNLHVRHKTNNTCVIIIMFSACVVNHARTSNHHLHATSRRLSARQDDFPQVPVWSPVVHTHTHTTVQYVHPFAVHLNYIYIYIVSSHLNYNY